MPLRVVMLGDIVGQPGRRVVEQQVRVIRDAYRPDLLIVNAENIAGGSGITPRLYSKLLSYGVDGITLGDHVYRSQDIVPTLNSSDRISRPANLPRSAAGRQWLKLHTPDGRMVCVITVLGRIFMNGPYADDPFAAVDRVLTELPDETDAVIVEIHCETTAEKIAVGHHLDGRVGAVIGTHTHVPTADARILPGGTAFITDIGMCGPYDSVIGRRKDRVLHHMRSGMPTPFGVATDDVRACGVLVNFSDRGLAESIERIEYSADTSRPPFRGE